MTVHKPPQIKPGWLIVATLFVLAAVATMVALGVWQLQRKAEKEAMFALHQRNIAMSAEVAFPMLPPVDGVFYFRRSRVVCLEPMRFTPRAGRDATGKSTFRTIADCRTGAEGPGALIAIGTSDDFAKPPNWKGGEVSGVIVPGPEQPTLLDRLFGRAVPARAMLIASPAVAGWGGNAIPRPDDTSNSHLLYAIQWFIFAGAAALIYALAVRRRLRG